MASDTYSTLIYSKRFNGLHFVHIDYFANIPIIDIGKIYSENTVSLHLCLYTN